MAWWSLWQLFSKSYPIKYKKITTSPDRHWLFISIVDSWTVTCSLKCEPRHSLLFRVYIKETIHRIDEPFDEFNMRKYITSSIQMYLWYWYGSHGMKCCTPDMHFLFERRATDVITISLTKSQTGITPVHLRWRYHRLLLGHSWWRHQMESFSTLLALCARNCPVTGEFP